MALVNGTNGPWLNYGYAAPYVVSAAASSASGTTLAVTLSQGIPANTAVLVVGVATSSCSTVAWTTGGTGTWGVESIDGLHFMAILGGPNRPAIASGSVLTATFAASATVRAMQIIAVPGAQPLTDPSGYAETSGTSATPSVTASQSMSLGDNVAIASIYTGTTDALTWTSNWTTLSTQTTGGQFTTAWQAASGAGTFIAGGTLATSMAWRAQVAYLRYLRPTPVVPSFTAGQVVTSLQMNQLSYAADFAARKPLLNAICDTTSVASGSQAAIPFSQGVILDSDGMYPQGYVSANAYIQRAGMYAAYFTAQTAALSVSAANTYILIAITGTAGPNNPTAAAGSSLWGNNGCWECSMAPSGVSGYSTGFLSAGGPMPVALYPGDYLTPSFANHTGAAVSVPGAWFAVEYLGAI